MKEGSVRVQIVRTKRFDEGHIKEARGWLIGSNEDAEILHHVGDGRDGGQELVLQIPMPRNEVTKPTIAC